MSQLDLSQTHTPRPAGCSLFLAVFPDEQAARDIYELGVELRNRHGLSGRVRPLDHLHISVPCLTKVPDDLNQVVQLADRACKMVAHTTPPFRVTFDRILSFRGQPMKHALVLVGSKEGNNELKVFHRILAAKFSNPGSAIPKFTPHMTMLYDREITEQPISPLSWKVNKVVLVQSHVGATKYDRLAHWTLGG